MAFKAGAIYGEARLDTKKWDKGLAKLTRAAKLAAVAVAAAFVAMMVSATKKANDFQKAMANVSTLVDTTTVNMRDLTYEILKLSPALGGTTELTKGMYQAFSSGARTAEDALETTVVAAKFARAALTDTFTAVDVLTTAMNAYGRENMSASKAADIFFQTIKYGKIVGEELAASIGTSIPLFATAGIELEELTAAMAAMTKQGVSAHRATTQLNAIVRAFLAPSEEMQQALYDIGFESGSTFLEVNGLAGALKLIEDNAQGDATELRKLLPNIRGMKGVMALSGQGAKEFAFILDEMANAAGVSTEAFEKQEKTWATYKNSADKLQIVVGNIAKIFVDKLAVGATAANEAMTEFLLSTEGMQVFATAAGYVAGGFELIKQIVQPFIDKIGEDLKEVVDTISEGMKDLFGEVDASSAGFIVLAGAMKIGLMVFSVFTKIIKTYIEYVVDLVLVIKETALIFKTFFEALINPAKWGDVWTQVKKTGDSIFKLGKGIIDNVGEMLTEVWDGIKGFAGDTEELAAEIERKVKLTTENVGEYVRNMWAGATTGQDAYAKRMGATWGAIMNDISGFGRTLVYETREKIVAPLEAEWENYAEYILDIFKELSSGIFDIISQGHTNEEAEQRLHLQNQLKALQEQLDNEEITQEQYDEKRAILEEESNKKLNDIAEKAFEAGKANRIAQIWMDVASGILAYAASTAIFGPIAGPILTAAMAALMTGFGITQSAAIAEQVFVPSYAKGGAVRVNEQGGEIINLPNNSVVIPNDISRQIANNMGQGTVIHVSFAGANISDDVSLDRVVSKVIRKLGREMRLAV